MPVQFQLFDRLRCLFKRHHIYRGENILQDQDDIRKVIQGNAPLDFGKSSSILEQTMLQINRLERYKDYDQMDEVGTITMALDIYSDEATLIDPEKKHSIMVKSGNKNVKKIVEEFLYNTLMIDRYIRPMIRYLCKFGDFATEIVPTHNKDGVSSIRFLNIYNFTRIQTKYGDLVGFYFQDKMASEPIFLHPWQVMHTKLESFETQYWPYGRCYDVNGPIWTPNGWSTINDLKIGDKVYSFNQKEQKPAITKVLNKIISGVKPTLLINTKHRSIKVTYKHPVLAIIKDKFGIEKIHCSGSKRNKSHMQSFYKRDINTKQYVLAEDLVLGDKLVLPKIYLDGTDTFIKTYMSKHGKKMLFPEFVTEDFARLMGFLIGDGWILTNNNTLCFAEGEYDEINKEYIDIIKSFGYDKDPIRVQIRDNPYGYFKFHSVELSKTLLNMGLVGKCYEKKIPEWVFTSKESIKKAFIEGLVDSDGSTNVDKWNCTRYQLEVTSEKLVRGLKILLDQMNVKCGNVGKRNRSSMFTVIHGKKYVRRSSWILYWYDSKMPCGNIVHKGRKLTVYDNCSNDYVVESIISINDGGEVEVGDVQVEENGNFIANGVVVHNSVLDGGRKDFKRLRLMEDAAIIYRVTRAPERRVFSIPVGQIPPHEVPEYMSLIAGTMKKKRFVDPATGQFNERWSPLIQEDDYFLPRRPDGTGPTVDTLPGAENLDSIADIEYFKKNMVAGLKIPFNRLGIGESGENVGKSLASLSPEFAKAIQWIQREVVVGLKKICLVHLALRGQSVMEMKNFDLYMTAASAIDELYRIETWNTRSTIMENLKGLGFFPDEWIVQTFTDLTIDEIEDMRAKKTASIENIASQMESCSESQKKIIVEALSMLSKKKSIINELNPIEFFINNNELGGLDGNDFPKLLKDNKLCLKMSEEKLKLINETKDRYKDTLTSRGVCNTHKDVNIIAESMSKR